MTVPSWFHPHKLEAFWKRRSALLRRFYTASLASLICSFAQTPPAPAPSQPQGAGRTFFWKELNLVGFHSPRTGRFDSTPRPQRTSAGFEYAGAFPRKPVLSALLGDRLRGVSFDVHPLAIYDPVDRRPKFVFHDAWIRVGLKNRPQTSFRIGHFLIPFGQNPVLEPRGFFFLPLTAADLGFKRDWGVSFQSAFKNHVYEIALTAGSGLGIHRRDGSYVVTGRIGAPAYRRFQYGLSALYGEVPEIRAERIVSGRAITRWRTAADVMYKYGSYTTFKSEFAVGEDAGAPVLGYQTEVDHVLPRFQNWELKLQLGSWFDDLNRENSTNTFVLGGLSYSVSVSTTLSANYMHDFQRSGNGMKDDRLFLQLHFYR